jgi:hypothetical protein
MLIYVKYLVYLELRRLQAARAAMPVKYNNMEIAQVDVT